MSDANLSENELDALQEEMKRADDLSFPTLRFSDPGRVSHRANTRMSLTSEKMGQALNAVLQKRLPVNLAMAQASLLVKTEDEIEALLRDLCCFGRFTHGTHGTLALVGPDRRLGYTLIEQAFGAPGLHSEENEVFVPQRPPTSIEYEALTPILEECLECILSATQLKSYLKCFVAPAGISPSLDRPCETGLVWQLDFRVGSFYLITYPEWIELFSSHRAVDVSPLAIKAHLDKIHINLCLELGRIKMSLSDIGLLKPGMVIPLPTSAEKPLPIRVGEKEVFRAEPRNESGVLTATILEEIR